MPKEKLQESVSELKSQLDEHGEVAAVDKQALGELAARLEVMHVPARRPAARVEGVGQGRDLPGSRSKPCQGLGQNKAKLRRALLARRAPDKGHPAGLHIPTVRLALLK